MPIEHKALDEIVAGFSNTLGKAYPHPIKIKVANAQGDLNLQRAIIQQMRDEKYALIVPIGTDVSQMSLAAIKQQPVLSLAATIVQDKANKKCHVAIVHDEIPAEKIIKFIHTAYPTLTHLVLIHSPSEKVFPEIKSARIAAKQVGIEIKTLMVPTLNDLYSAAKQIPANAEGILVLKDHLIVSGISTLSLAAEKRHIPLITTDQGSVEAGAAFALGVHEREIGIAGAKLAEAILQGKAPCDLPIIYMTTLTVFVNKAVLLKEKQSLAALALAAEKEHYSLEVINE